jgi:hypothetical protein
MLQNNVSKLDAAIEGDEAASMTAIRNVLSDGAWPGVQRALARLRVRRD